jgi:hypothetical protein
LGVNKVKPTTCYLTAEEERAVEEIAAKDERPKTKVIQIAVRQLIERVRSEGPGALRPHGQGVK